MAAKDSAPCDAAPRRGLFIVFEGLDKAGKTTQTERLCTKLRGDGAEVLRLKFPDRTSAMGKVLDAYLQSEQTLQPQVSHLLFVADRWQKDRQIRAALAAGTTVVADRYSFSGVAYAVGAVGLEWGWAAQPEEGLVAPDVVYFMDAGAAVVAARGGGFGEERFEQEATLGRVYEAFRRFDSLACWRRVDATRGEEEIHDEVAADVDRRRGVADENGAAPPPAAVGRLRLCGLASGQQGV